MFGLGLWKVPIDICADLVYDSIKLGVRHLDCACDYGNEVQVGAGDRNLFSSQIYTFLTN
jgi:D-xylose reductase